jgi:hypothetical protein
MSEISVLVRTADRTKKAEITVSDTQTCADIIQAAVQNWALPTDADYTIANVSRTPAQTLNPSTPLSQSGVMSGETLEIQPVLVAGGHACD